LDSRIFLSFLPLINNHGTQLGNGNMYFYVVVVDMLGVCNSSIWCLYVFRAQNISKECPTYVKVSTWLYMALPPHVSSNQKLVQHSPWHETTPL
jgi:hypothetical protein